MARTVVRRPLLLLACIGAVWLIVICAVGDNGLVTLMRQKHTIDSLEREVEALQATNASLTADIERLKDDDKTIEAVAREELLMTRPGERVICILP